MIDIGKRIKELRNEKELSSKELAKKVDISPGYMSLLEANKRTCNIVRLEKICNALEVPIVDFFSYHGKKDRDEYESKRMDMALNSLDFNLGLKAMFNNNRDENISTLRDSMSVINNLNSIGNEEE
ncbi:MAG: helix-turn-helix domain-containing protein [Tissierellales bacterium]|nr:helix-turn-helix domain-containing protein [Tissierellales bacterium]